MRVIRQTTQHNHPPVHVRFALVVRPDEAELGIVQTRMLTDRQRHKIWAAIISWQILLVSILWRIFRNRSRPPKQSEKDEYRIWLVKYRDTIHQRKKKMRSQEDAGSSDAKDEYQAWLEDYRGTINQREKEKRAQEDTGFSDAKINSHLIASECAESTDHAEQEDSSRQPLPHGRPSVDAGLDEWLEIEHDDEDMSQVEIPRGRSRRRD